MFKRIGNCFIKISSMSDTTFLMEYVKMFEMLFDKCLHIQQGPF